MKLRTVLLELELTDRQPATEQDEEQQDEPRRDLSRHSGGSAPGVAESDPLARRAAATADPPKPSDASQESGERIQRPAAASPTSSPGPEREREALCSIVDTAESTHDVAAVFDRVEELAELPLAEWAKVKHELKRILGSDLNLNDLEHAVAAARKSQVPPPPSGELPVVVVGSRQLREEVDDALEALRQANERPVLFERGGQLVRVEHNEHDRPIVEAVSNAALRGMLARAADFYVLRQNGHHPIAPPMEIAQYILSSATRAFPSLNGVVEVPVLRPDGSALGIPGYDEATGLLYVPDRGFTLPTVREEPTPQDVQDAVALLYEVVEDFRFETPESRCNAFGMFLTPIVRPMIGGAVPLAIIDAPQAGTGKSLLANVAAVIATGRPAAVTDAPGPDEEFDKRITALLLEGVSVVVMDNLARKLGSPSLSRALTASRWAGRILGRSAIADVPQRATWIVTGNNVSVFGDLVRRCYPIRIDAKTSQPWKRSGFRHDPLLDWVMERRADLVAALLTLTRAWIAAGRPAANVSPVFGSFQEWADVIGGVLSFAGVPGFLGNLDSFYDRQNPDDRKYETFLLALHDIFRGKDFTAADVAQLMKTDHGEDSARLDLSHLPDDLAEVWERNRRSFTRRLAQAFARIEDARYGDTHVHVTRVGSTHRAIAWRVCLPTEDAAASLNLPPSEGSASDQHLCSQVNTRNMPTASAES